MIRSLRLFFHPSKTSPLPPIAGVAIVFRSFYFGSFATQLQCIIRYNPAIAKVNTFVECYQLKQILIQDELGILAKSIFSEILEFCDDATVRQIMLATVGGDFY